MWLRRCVATSDRIWHGFNSEMWWWRRAVVALWSFDPPPAPNRWFEATSSLSMGPVWILCLSWPRADPQCQTHEPIRQSKQHGSPPGLHQLRGLLLTTSRLPDPTRGVHLYYLLLVIHTPKHDPSSANVPGPGGAGGEWQQLEFHHLLIQLPGFPPGPLLRGEQPLLDGGFRLRGHCGWGVNPAAGGPPRGSLQRLQSVRRWRLVDGKDPRQGGHLPEQLRHKERLGQLQAADHEGPGGGRRWRMPLGDKLRWAAPGGGDRSWRLWEGLQRSLAERGGSSEGCETRPRWRHQCHGGERAAGGQAVLDAAASQHNFAPRGLPAGAQPVPGDGVRQRRRLESSSGRKEGPSQGVGELGRADRNGDGLSTQPGFCTNHPQRPQVQQ